MISGLRSIFDTGHYHILNGTAKTAPAPGRFTLKAAKPGSHVGILQLRTVGEGGLSRQASSPVITRMSGWAIPGARRQVARPSV